MKLISNQINPHFTLADSLHAVSSIFVGKFSKSLDPLFEQKFYSKNLILTNTARSALGLICDTVKPDPNKRIGIPAFVCAVVATPFLSRGYEIEWIDTDDNGLIDVKDFETKADNIGLLVVPHIFGQNAPLKAVMEVAKRHDIFVVEDGAHLIRQFELGFKPICDAQILSFGREKVISCVSGGALIWPDKSSYHYEFQKIKHQLKSPGLLWAVRHALQPLVFALSLPWWHQGGKGIAWLARTLRLLPLAVTTAEKNGEEDILVRKMSLIQKRILARQLKLWDNRQLHAQAIALAWKQSLGKNDNATVTIPPLAFRTLVKFTAPHFKENLLHSLKKNTPNLILEDWSGIPISPKGVNYKRFGYRPGQCKNAEYFARTYLTFPTNIRITKADVKQIAQTLSST